MKTVLKPFEELIHVGYLYVTDVTERYEEQNLYSDDIQRRYREKLLQKIPLYGIRNIVSGDFG